MAKKRKQGAKQAAAPESRGKQRRRAAREARVVRERIAPAAPLEPAAEPTFWFGFEVTWAKLVLGRVIVFALLAFDALMQLSHAPRYGAGDFNVAQLPLLDSLAPGRVLYGIGQLVCAYLFMLVACGVATRIALPIVAALYGWLYFGSHLDSYQHHYLVWLVLVLACFVPWERPANALPATRVRSWALRLLLVQLAILYLWAAISKLDLAWLDGRTLSGQITGGMRKLIDSTIGIKGASLLVVVVELALAATVWMRRAWPIAAPLGLALHLGIAASGLEIGLFAWLMIGMYIFIIPDSVWIWLADRQPLPALRSVLTRIRAWRGSRVVWFLAVTASASLALANRFEYGTAAGLVLLGVLVVATIAARTRVAIAWLAIAHLLGLVTWTAVDRTTSTASDYYRLWGGSSRRLGDLKTSEHAYRQMIRVAPDEGNGHYQLGRLLLQRNDEAGLAELHRAQDLEPLKARAYAAEARWLAAHGRRDEAIAKAREATIVEPEDAEARSTLDNLIGKP